MDGDKPHRLIPLPEGPVVPVCETCTMPISEAYCGSDFVITGTVTRVRLDLGEDESSAPMHYHRFIKVALISVIKNNSDLNLFNLLLQQTRSIEIRLDVDETCPCPNMKTILKEDNAILTSISTRRTGKSATHRHNTKLLLMGKVVNGLPVLDSAGYVARENKQDLDRIRNLSKTVNLCAIIKRLQNQYS